MQIMEAKSVRPFFFVFLDRRIKQRENLANKQDKKTNKESTFQNVSQTIKKADKNKKYFDENGKRVFKASSRSHFGGKLKLLASRFPQAILLYKLSENTNIPASSCRQKRKKMGEERKEKKKCFKVKSKVLSIRTCVS